MNEASTHRGCHRDTHAGTRGAITVAAVFMAAALVGALWYVIGIADAIVYRQQMQDAADIAAYTGAVYHARGMNLIALINVVMGAILAVLVALKLVQMLNFAALVLSCSVSSLCSVGVGCWAVPICSFTTEFRAEIAAAIDRYQHSVVGRLLPALAQTQQGIAAAMPAVALAKAASVPRAQSLPSVTAAGILTTSLVPSRSGQGYGLPVAPGSYSALCSRAGQDVAEVAFSPFPFAGWLRGVTGTMASSFSGYFCDGSLEVDVASERSAIEQQCELRQQAHEQESEAQFDLDACQQQVRRELGERFLEQTRDVGRSERSSSRPRPMEVSAAANNGGPLLQVWSVVLGDTGSLRSARRGVEVATHNRSALGGVDTSLLLGRVGFAQAEFYYDTDRRWSEVRQEALWNMRWRARLRRVRPPSLETAELLARAVARLSPDLREFVRNGAAACTWPLSPACRSLGQSSANVASTALPPSGAGARASQPSEVIH
jgi:hypothetical protein